MDATFALHFPFSLNQGGYLVLCFLNSNEKIISTTLYSRVTLYSEWGSVNIMFLFTLGSWGKIGSLFTCDLFSVHLEFRFFCIFIIRDKNLIHSNKILLVANFAQHTDMKIFWFTKVKW